MLLVSAGQWQRLGLEAEILATGTIVGEYGPALEKAGYTIRHLPFARSIRFLAGFYSLLKEGGYDIVHIHTERASFAYAMLARIAGIETTVRTVHNTFRFTGWLGIKRSAQRLAARRLGVRFGMISASVAEVERKYLHNHGVPITNWFDSSRFATPQPSQRKEARRQLGLEPGTLAIVSVGNCSPVKNHMMLIRALSKVKHEVEYLYIHIGQGDDIEVERKLAGDLRIIDRVWFLGSLPDPLPFLWAADVFIMPSKHEGFPIAATEAMGAGCPVIFADVPGLRDFKELGPGISYAACTQEGLASAIVDFYRQPNSVHRAAAVGISERVHSLFSIQKGVDCIVKDLYQIPNVSELNEGQFQEQP